MSDLISRSELLKRLEEWNTSDGTDKSLYNFTLCRIIEQPTAYDINKVVKELEKRKQEYLDGFVVHENNELYGVACGLGDAIEIVKQGGVSDDVCEWKSASDGEFIQNPHTKRLYSNEPSMQNVYCNTCGKKIKVVE